MYTFKIQGHRLITAEHPTTIEFTRDSELGVEGDCIVGVSADFEPTAVKQFIKEVQGKLVAELRVGNYIERITGTANPAFNHETEIVLRKSSFVSGRTLMIHADKGSMELSRELVKLLRTGQKGIVMLSKQ
ncbi:DUF371 domain-containing protein [Candidatus Woesearchaeota archaeon]|nr:DUF371 domain-containing protein [Candidatus Woesearchaeota archaeon]